MAEWLTVPPFDLILGIASQVPSVVAGVNGCAMKSIRYARIVIVTGIGSNRQLAARLRRMSVSSVLEVERIDQAQKICTAGGADLCLLVLNCRFDEEFSCEIDEAPGFAGKIPSLLLAEVVTPYLRKIARRQGYRMVVPARTVARMLYRRIGAALQRPRALRQGRRHGAVLQTPKPGIVAWPPPEIGKPTLH